MFLVGCSAVDDSRELENDHRIMANDVQDSTNNRSDTPASDLIPDLPEPEQTQANNSIDRAFLLVADERKDELESNTTFAYLYALAWFEEYLFLSGENLPGEPFEVTYGARWEQMYSSNSSYYRQLLATAREYAETWSDSNKASAKFDGIARFFRLMAYDVLARADEQGVSTDVQTDEQELYQYLMGVDFADQMHNDYDSFISSIINDTGNPMPFYTDLKDEGAYIAFAPPFGMVLSYKGEKHLFPWAGGDMSPRRDVPRLYMYDYDGDGLDELAVIVTVGTGTEFYLEYLYIVSFGEHYGVKLVTAVTDETLERLLRHRVSASYDPIADEYTVRLDDQMVRVDMSWLEKEYSRELRGIDLGSIVLFEATEGALNVHIHIGLVYGEHRVIPLFPVEFYADVIYDGSSAVSLTNCRIERTRSYT